MFRSLAVLALVCGLLAATSSRSLAEVRAGDVTVTPMVGYHVFDGGLDLEDNAAYGLAIGYNFTKHWAFELDGRIIQTDANGWHGPDVDVLMASANFLYHIAPEQDFVPYLAFGAGGMVYDVDGPGGTDEDWIANWGGGFKYALNRNVNLRLDLRHVLDYINGDLPEDDDTRWRHHMSAMFGMNFQFGGAPAQTAAPVEPMVQKMASVAPPAPAVALPPLDSDRDGVPDSADKCADTPPGVRIDASGCPADSDGDGVPDYHDACLDTPKGALVDARGCPHVIRPIESLTLYLIYASGKDQVTPFHYRELDKAHAFIQKYPDRDIVVEGHTDNQGADDYNLKLSQRRAENVRKALIEKYGVAAERISAQGFGESQPLASNDTISGREQNRRVIISIMQ